MIFLIYTILVILQQYKGVTTVVQDPCPSDIKGSTIVADMCKRSFATENLKHSGGHMIDSVVLRIMIHQDNCTCRVKIENRVGPISTALTRYEDYFTSSPNTSDCGLAVDINHLPDMSTENVIPPINCLKNVAYRTIPLLQDSTLQFRSRIINGSFTRGYCMRIQRDINFKKVVLKIDCDDPLERAEATVETITYASTSETSSDSLKSTTERTTRDPTTTGIEQTTYIGIGAGSGVALILLVVLVVICLRKRSTQKAETNGNVRKSYQQEESNDKLSDNVLYVPGEEFDITGGKCSTADVDTANVSNKRLSMEEDYSTVDEDTRISPNERLSVEDNYSTVDEDMPKYSNERLSMEGDYSTVDEDTRTSLNERLSVEGNYCTVDDDMPKSTNERLSVVGNYSTVDEDTPKFPNNRLRMDGTYSTVKLGVHLERNCSNPENSEQGQTKGQHKPTIKPKPKSSCIKSEDNRSSDQNIKHLTPPNGSDNVYAVVDKTSKNVPTPSGCKGEGTCQPDQTYAVVDKARKCKSSPDETNKKKFGINSGNR